MLRQSFVLESTDFFDVVCVCVCVVCRSKHSKCDISQQTLHSIFVRSFRLSLPQTTVVSLGTRPNDSSSGKEGICDVSSWRWFLRVHFGDGCKMFVCL